MDFIFILLTLYLHDILIMSNFVDFIVRTTVIIFFSTLLSGMAVRLFLMKLNFYCSDIYIYIYLLYIYIYIYIS